MINEISKKAGKYLDYAVELLKELIAHKSVAAEAQKGMPYGRDCADCLAFAEDFLIDCQVKCNKINEKIYKALRGEYENQGVYGDDY